MTARRVSTVCRSLCVYITQRVEISESVESPDVSLSVTVFCTSEYIFNSGFFNIVELDPTVRTQWEDLGK